MKTFTVQTTQQQPSRRKHRRGATAIEFALVAPSFLIVLAVCGEFARLSMMRNLSQNAAYEAARFVMTEGATVADGIARANAILGRIGTVDAIVTINGSDGTVGSNGTVQNEITFDTQEVTCSVQIPLNKNSLIVPERIFGNSKINSSMTIRTERYRGYFEATTN